MRTTQRFLIMKFIIPSREALETKKSCEDLTVSQEILELNNSINRYYIQQSNFILLDLLAPVKPQNSIFSGNLIKQQPRSMIYCMTELITKEPELDDTELQGLPSHWENISPVPMDEIRATTFNQLPWIEDKGETRAEMINSYQFCLRRVFEGDEAGFNVITKEGGQIMVRRFNQPNQVMISAHNDLQRPIYTSNSRLFLGPGQYPGTTVIFDQGISLDSERINATIPGVQNLIEVELERHVAQEVNKLYEQLKTKLEFITVQAQGLALPEYVRDGLKQAAIHENYVQEAAEKLPEKAKRYTESLKSLGVVFIQDWGVSKFTQLITQGNNQLDGSDKPIE